MPEPSCFTPSRCHINLAAIARNFARLGHPHTLMPVIKSDAYGHGLLPIAKTLARAGAARFAVGLVAEGLALRNAGYLQDILLLMGCLSFADWQLAQAERLTPLAASFADLEAAAALHKPVSIAIKCDSGMGRLGFTPDALPSLVNFLRAHPQVMPHLVVSHLACSDMPEEDSYTRSQTDIFQAFQQTIRDTFPEIASSLCNSAAAMSQIGNDISRPGLAIYGGNPFGCETPCDLEWAMSVSSPIIAVHPLAKGQSLSYGRIFTAPKDMLVAVIACGYATGYNRNLSNRAEMLVHGKRCRQIGRICMSMAMLDVTDIPDTRVGEEAWLMGGKASAGETPVTPWELARILDTIPYELLCLFGSLNARDYNEN